jgi:protein TonB
MLVNGHTTQTPREATTWAQASIEGGGNAEEGIAQSPLPQSNISPNAIVLEALRQRQAQLEALQQQLLVQLEANLRTQPPRLSDRQKRDEAHTLGEHDQDQDSVLQNAQLAALSARVQAYSKRARHRFIAPSVQASRYAQYLDAWRIRIEAVGTQHYPAQAGQRLYGTLRITVYLRADGTVAAIDIDDSTPQAALNQAARRIVQLATPFAPFPPEISRDTDILAITRTWNFVNGMLATQAP